MPCSPVLMSILFDRLDDNDIIMISDIDIFLSLPSYLNVLQSPHKAWLFLTEIMLYGYLPWESLAAATVSNWRFYVIVMSMFLTMHFQKNHAEFLFLLRVFLSGQLPVPEIFPGLEREPGAGLPS